MLIPAAGTLSPTERMRARLTLASLVVASAVFAIEASVQVSRSQLELAIISGVTVMGLSILLVTLRLTGAVRLVAQGAIAVLVVHALAKILGVGDHEKP
ncbi:MAG: hypothetical protein GY937_22435 [bacterium]|nr:hypothetical protein [bacterium]